MGLTLFSLKTARNVARSAMMGQARSKHRIHADDLSRFQRRATLLFCTLLTCGSACDRSDPKPKRPHSHEVVLPDEVTFGTSDLGFVSWLESNGAFVITHRFDEDTNGDGQKNPNFGDHGEPEGDWPSVWLQPLPSGEAERFDELVTSDPANRWVVMRRGEELIAISASKRWPLDGADPTPGPSPCLAARQASIDPTSTWLAFIRSELQKDGSRKDRAVVKNLASGKEREVPAEGLLWRADAMPRGWVMLREVLADTDGDGAIAMPRREGTCICRWCNRFAASVGAGKLVGDESREVMVDTQNRRATPPRTPIPLGPDAVWSLAENQLYAFDGSKRQIGKGCTMRLIPLGTDRIIANCGGEYVVWNASTEQAVPLEKPVNALQPYSPPSGGWVAVQFTDDEGKQRVGRLSLGDGRIEPGPTAIRWGSPHPSGWRLVADESKLYAWDVSTGVSTTLDVTGAKIDGLVAHRGQEWFPIDPHKRTPIATLADTPRFVAANGCFVAPHPYNQPVRGPFQWKCH